MDFSSFMQQRTAEAQQQKLDPLEEAARNAHLKQYGYPKDSTLGALMTLWVKAKAAERIANSAAYHNPTGQKNKKPAKAALRLLNQARIDRHEKERWIRNFLKVNAEQQPEFKTVQGNFFVGVNEFLKAEVGSPEEKEAMSLMMMAKRLSVVLYPGEDMMGEIGANGPTT